MSKDEALMALAVSGAENGKRTCDRESLPNYDGSLDRGLFQINSVHIKRFGLKKILDCQGNIDVAFQIWTEQKWKPWSTFSQNKHIARLEAYKQQYKNSYPN